VRAGASGSVPSDSMATRLDLIDEAAAPILARPYFGRGGNTSPIVRALAQVPELVPPTMAFLGQILGASSIDLRAKEIVILRVSAQAGCVYCIGAHTVAAADAGLSSAELRAIREGTPGDGVLGGAEVALLALSDAIAGGGVPPAAVLDAVRAVYAEHGLVELTLLASATLMLNRFCTTLRLPLGDAAAARLVELGVGA
jgi:AhpD family alkylhydroperoxidase